ncbi:MAG: peptidoglycan-binding protein [Oscillospiraceae bacterium]|nr:peptidoglycan-binding protein [Oscillospiraceae bacterium]
MSKANIWALLKQKGFSDNAAAAIMGNMEAESNCISYRLQGDFGTGYQKSLQYTQQVDNGSISRYDFTRKGPGGGGYGLCQWTYYSRKEGLYDWHASSKRSIGDEALQVDWLWGELHQGEYSSVLTTLNGNGTISEMSDAFVLKFERPADQSVSACARRAALGMEIYRQFAGKSTAVNSEDEGEAEETVSAPFYRDATDNWPPRTIQRGMTGFDVAVLRRILTALGYDCYVKPETFDERLRVMTMAYQGENGLDTDGIAGPMTWRSLGVST